MVAPRRDRHRWGMLGTAEIEDGGGRGDHAAFFRELATATSRVHVFRADPGLLDGVPARTADVLAQRIVLPRLCVAAGPWVPRLPAATEGEVLGLLILEGLLERTADVGKRCGPELLGPGDVIRPWDEAPDGAVRCTWQAHERTVVAVLDDRFSAVACRSPRVLANLMRRMAHRSQALAARLAIGQVRSAEDRIVLLMHGLGERWGRVTPEGVHIPFALQHETIGRLACMRRPTASTALAALQRTERLVRRPDRTWVLPRDVAVPPVHLVSTPTA